MSPPSYNVAKGKPKIDDQFWFNMSETIVSGAIESIRIGAERIQHAVIWSFGIYTGVGTLLTITYDDFSYIPRALFIAILLVPYFFLYRTYWLSNEVMMPNTMQIDGRMPDKIKNEFKRVYQETYAKLEKAKNSAFLSFIVFFVCLSLTIASEYLPKIEHEEFKAQIHSDSNSIVVEANLPANQLFIYSVFETLEDSRLATTSDTLLMDNSGKFNDTFKLHKLTKSVEVSFTWQNEDGYQLRKSKVYKNN